MKTNKAAALLGGCMLFGLFGCSITEGTTVTPEKPVPAPALQAVDAPAMKIKLEKEDPPAFKRIYVGDVNGRKITITARTTMFGDRDWGGELTQKNGNWVLFDPKNIADKILDLSLVPLIQQFVNAAIVQDAIFLKTANQFTDNQGNTWSKTK